MNTLRILIHRGKYSDQYWLANTPTRAKQAREMLFRQIDEMGYYSLISRELLTKARAGNAESIAKILDSRRNCEYEQWDYEDIVIPPGKDIPEATELLDFNAYQKSAHGTAVYPQHAGIYYATLGLTGEAGEIANKVKKILRDDKGEVTPEKKEAILKELGDVFWYAAEIATVLGADLSEVAGANLENLYSRKKRGTLKGDGDNR